MGFLTGPVHTLTDWNVEYNGFLIGPTTQFEVPQGGTDILDMAAVKTMDVSRVWADGSFSGPDFSDVLLPQVQVEIGGTSLANFQANVAAFRGAFSPQAAGLPLWVKVPGMPPLGVLAKPHKRSIPADWGWNAGLITAGLQFRCTDPWWQSVPRTVLLAAAGGQVSGLVFPMFNVASGTYAVPGVADFGSTSTVAASAVLTNAGNTPAWPVVFIPGPWPGGSIFLGGQAVTYTGTLQASDSLVIDYATGLATLNGSVDRTYNLTSRQFTSVPAGGSVSVFFSAPSGTAQVTTADIWR